MDVFGSDVNKLANSDMIAHCKKRAFMEYG